MLSGFQCVLVFQTAAWHLQPTTRVILCACQFACQPHPEPPLGQAPWVSPSSVLPAPAQLCRGGQKQACSCLYGKRHAGYDYYNSLTQKNVSDNCKTISAHPCTHTVYSCVICVCVLIICVLLFTLLHVYILL